MKREALATAVACLIAACDPREAARECLFSDFNSAQVCQIATIGRDTHFADQMIVSFAAPSPACVLFTLHWTAHGTRRTGNGTVPWTDEYTKSYQFQRTQSPRVEVPPYHQPEQWEIPQAVACTSFAEFVPL